MTQENKTNKQIINLSETAKEELKRLIKLEKDNPDGVRISLLAGGCSGLSYHLEFGKMNPNDYIDNYDDLKILIDPKSALYITGLTVEYQGGLTGRGFVFANPNATKSCGCGTSFSVGDKEITLEFISNKKPSNICPSTKEE